MKRFFYIIFVILISILSNYIISIWKGISLTKENLSKESLRRAIKLNPSNPDPFYRLSLFYQWDFQNIDLQESIKYLKQAIERNPLEQQYYLNLFKTLNRMGKEGLSEEALEKALLVFPTSYQGRWVAGNLLLQKGAYEKAIPYFKYILFNYPGQSDLVYDVILKTFKDSDFIFEQIIPKDSSSINQYLSYLYEIGDKESAKKVWDKKNSYGIKSERAEALRHIEFLIAHNDLSEAFRVWKERLHEEGLSTPSDGDLITNGGFEKKEILGGGFDWKIKETPGAMISFDHFTAFEGKSSLKIDFNGKENVDFQHIFQYVPLKPGAKYILKACIKTKQITTKSGIRIEVLGIGSTFHEASESLIGDNEWKEILVPFRTPVQSRGGVVRIRREKIDKFDRFISGTAWIDNVSLREKSQ